MLKRVKTSLAVQVVIAMILGILAGLVAGDFFINLGFIGTIWLNGIKMVIIPMILTTLVVGIISQKDLKSLGRVSIRIMLYYICTTVCAAIIGIIVAQILSPGLVANLTNMATQKVGQGADITFASFMTGLVSDNLFATFSKGNIVQTLVIAIMMGIGILMIPDKTKVEHLVRLFESLEAMISGMIGIVMKLSPIGIFFLMADSFGKYGTSIFSGIGALLVTFYIGCILQIFIIYGGILWIGVRINPFEFIKKSFELIVYAISTCSSVAAIPVNIRVAKEKFNISEKISGFTVPLGSQVNSDGSVILYSCIILFIAQMNHVDMGISELIQIVLLGTIFSLGGSGIPGSNIVKVLVLVEAFGLPVEIVGIVAAFYRLFDMGTTTNNSLGDLAGTVLVGKLEEKVERKECKADLF